MPLATEALQLSDFEVDRTVVEAASWRLASELVRRHPATTRIRHTQPGGGQYDCLAIVSAADDEGHVDLNRNGRIHLLQRFDGLAGPEFEPIEWDNYLQADPRAFVDDLERSIGLPTPSHVPPSTSRTLTYRVLAALAVTASKSVHPIEIQPGYWDTSGWGGGPNDALDSFPAIPDVVRRPGRDDSGERFWVVLRDGVPILALHEDEGMAWAPHHDESFDLMDYFEQSRRNVLAVTVELLEFGDNI
jgi:hypothetical protein